MANEKELRIVQATRRKVVKRLVLLGFVLVIAGGLTLWLVFYLKNREQNLPGVFYPTIGAAHVPLNSAPPVPYNSNPPSSGAHFSTPARWGIYDYEVNVQIFIHNLEHGGIWISYRPDVAAGVVNDLKKITEEFGGSKIVMAPRSANDADIALAAWSMVLKIDSAESTLTESQKQQIREFYKRFKNRGPEFVPDTMLGVDPKSVEGGVIK